MKKSRFMQKIRESLFIFDQFISGTSMYSVLHNSILLISSYRISYVNYDVNYTLSDPVSHPVLHGHHSAETHITSVRYSPGTFLIIIVFDSAVAHFLDSVPIVFYTVYCLSSFVSFIPLFLRILSVLHLSFYPSLHMTNNHHA